MTSLALLAASAAAPAHLNPVKLFLDADIVVQVVMIGRAFVGRTKGNS